MKNQALANRYAKTLFSVTQKEKTLKAVQEQNILIIRLLNENKLFKKFLASPINKMNEKIDLIQKVFKDFDPTLLKFLILLCKKNRIEFLEDILNQFEILFNESQGIKKAMVTSVSVLNESELEKIKTSLKKKYNADFILSNHTDENLIGGFTVQIEDTVIDHSMKNKLELIEKNLLSVG